MKLTEMYETRKALTAERDSILAQDSMTVEVEARGHEVANELGKLDAEIRAAQIRERFASSSAIENLVKRDNEQGLDERSEKRYLDQWIGYMRGGRAPETRALTSTASSSVLIPKVYEDQILKYLDANSIMRGLADFKGGVSGYPVLRYNTLATNGKGTSTATGGWIAEGGSAVATDGAWTEVALAPQLCSPYTQITQTLAKMANFDVESEVMDTLQRALSHQLEFAYIGGTGSNMPTGIFDTASTTIGTYASESTPAGSTGATTRAQQVTACAADTTKFLKAINTMRYSTLPASYWTSGSAWIFPQDVYATVGALTVNSVPLFVPSADKGITEGMGLTLLGLPVYVTEYVPTLVQTASAKVCGFVLGNIRDSYSIREWGGISMIRDEVSAAATGQIKYTAMAFANANITRGGAAVQFRVTNP